MEKEHEKNYVVKYEEECGRYLVASKEIQKGDLIIEAYSNGVSIAHKQTTVCSCCYKKNKKTLNFSCSNCSNRYCSESCFSLKQIYHEYKFSLQDKQRETSECEIFTFIQKLKINQKTLEKCNIISDIKEIRILLRWIFSIIVRQELLLQLEISPPQQFNDHINLVDCLPYHPPERITELFNIYQFILHTLSSIYPNKQTTNLSTNKNNINNESESVYTKVRREKRKNIIEELFLHYVPTKEFFASLNLKKLCNGFAIFSGGECTLQGLFPGEISFINHSCASNLTRQNYFSSPPQLPLLDQQCPKTVIEKVVEMEPKILIFAKGDIKEGDPLFLNYLGEKDSLDLLSADRKQKLFDNYCFNCNCPICSVDQNL